MINIKKKWNFLFKQTFGNFRKNYLIIIGFSVTLSLVAGLAFYTQELEEYIVLETAPNLNDITIAFNEYNGNMVRDYSDYGEFVQNLIKETDIPIDTVAPFSKIRFLAIMNITPNNADIIPNFLICNDSFYDSEMFNATFEIISGFVPKNETSILIPIEFAEKYDLRIGQNLSIQLNYESFAYNMSENNRVNSSISLNGPKFNITAPDLVISGFYGLKNRDYIYFFSEIHRPENGRSSWLFFGFHDFTQHESLNPILNTYFMLQNHPLVTEIQKYYPITHGFSIFLDKSWIDPNWLNYQISFLSTEIYVLEQNIPSELILYEFITGKLEDIRNLLQSLQMGLPFINLPIGIFTIYIGGFLITMNLKNRLDEILLLKLRGVPFEILRSQIILENLINSFVSTVRFMQLTILPRKNIIYSIGFLCLNFQTEPHNCLVAYFTQFCVNTMLNFPSIPVR